MTRPEMYNVNAVGSKMNASKANGEPFSEYMEAIIRRDRKISAYRCATLLTYKDNTNPGTKHLKPTDEALL